MHGGAFGRARSGSESFVADDLVLSPEEREKRLALQAKSIMFGKVESGEASEETLGCAEWCGVVSRGCFGLDLEFCGMLAIGTHMKEVIKK